jgi:hypothetical protein
MVDSAFDVDAWFAELDRFTDTPLFEDGRNQPLTLVTANTSEFSRVSGLSWQDWTS